MLEKAARASHAEATHESSRAENKYDTRGLEAAYLAGGQARQAREVLEAVEIYENLSAKVFSERTPIDISALVEVEMDGVKSVFFIGPKNGGLEIIHNKREITVLTPQSPLGSKLMGKLQGASWTEKGGAASRYKILSVQ